MSEKGSVRGRIMISVYDKEDTAVECVIKGNFTVVELVSVALALIDQAKILDKNHNVGLERVNMLVLDHLVEEDEDEDEEGEEEEGEAPMNPDMWKGMTGDHEHIPRLPGESIMDYARRLFSQHPELAKFMDEPLKDVNTPQLKIHNDMTLREVHFILSPEFIQKIMDEEKRKRDGE